MNVFIKIIGVGVLLSYLSTSVASEQRHTDDSHSHDRTLTTNPELKGAYEESHEEGSSVATISSIQARLANITVGQLNAKKMNYRVYSPGEIKANGYTSYQVSPRVDSVVIRRHVALGDHVDEGQLLVTLFSERVAEAQGVFRIASAEWRRVKLMGRKAVGDKRFLSAKTDYDASYSRLLVYGLSIKAVNSFLDIVDTQQPALLGEYTLVANSGGVVLSDDFHQGQRVEPGEMLIELTQENTLWVEARLAPNTSIQLPLGSKAEINVGGELFDASVVQAAHTIDSKTRTRIVRLLVSNESHQLHPGQFADVHFLFKTKDPVLAVPESALMRGADGDWTVFVEENGAKDNAYSRTFSAREVELGRFFGEWREVHGVEPGSRIVMKGAFFVASEIAKSGFDPHNH